MMKTLNLKSLRHADETDDAANCGHLARELERLDGKMTVLGADITSSGNFSIMRVCVLDAHECLWLVEIVGEPGRGLLLGVRAMPNVHALNWDIRIHDFELVVRRLDVQDQHLVAMYFQIDELPENAPAAYLLSLLASRLAIGKPELP